MKEELTNPAVRQAQKQYPLAQSFLAPDWVVNILVGAIATEGTYALTPTYWLATRTHRST